MLWHVHVIHLACIGLGSLLEQALDVTMCRRHSQLAATLRIAGCTRRMECKMTWPGQHSIVHSACKTSVMECMAASSCRAFNALQLSRRLLLLFPQQQWPISKRWCSALPAVKGSSTRQHGQETGQGVQNCWHQCCSSLCKITQGCLLRCCNVGHSAVVLLLTCLPRPHFRTTAA